MQVAHAASDVPPMMRDVMRATGHEIVEPGDGRFPSFSEKRWYSDSFIALRGQTARILLIWATQSGRGYFTALLSELEKNGYRVEVFEPLDKMPLILHRKGFRRRLRFLDGQAVEMWSRDA